jgi:hypothetical protein
MPQSLASCCHNRFAGKSLFKILPDGVFGSSVRQITPPLGPRRPIDHRLRILQRMDD